MKLGKNVIKEIFGKREGEHNFVINVKRKHHKQRKLVEGNKINVRRQTVKQIMINLEIKLNKTLVSIGTSNNGTI